MPIKVLKASAGSGKTFTLTNEYLDLLEDSLHSQILAVTFTNKATEEMKTRIVEELHDRAEKGDAKAKEQLNKILHDYSHFNVSTIDKFFQKVVRSMFRELGFSGIYDLVLDNTLLVEEVVNEMRITLDQYPKAYELLLENAFKKLKEQKDFNFATEIKNLSKFLWHEAFLELSKEQLDNSYSYENVEKFYKECAGKREAILKEWADLAGKVKSSCNLGVEFKPKTKIGSFLKRIDAYKDKKENGFKFTEGQIPVLDAIAQGSVCGEEVLKCFFSASDLKNYKNALLSGDFDKAVIDFVKNYVDNKEEFSLLKIVLSNAQLLPILVEINTLIRNRLRERNEFLLSDVNHLLAGMIGESDAPFIYEKIGTQINHYLLDEFQDTSTMQWKNFIPLVRNSVADGKKSLVVGDVKQSIYRWRNSDWRILDSGIKKEFSVNVNEETLKYNWRSKKNIIDFNNYFFGKLVKVVEAGPEEKSKSKKKSETPVEEQGVQGGGIVSKTYSDVRQDIHDKRKHPEGGYVNWKIWKKPEGKTQDKSIDYAQAELDAIYADIQEALIKGYSPKDIGILVRSNDKGALIAKYLLEKGIDVISSESLFVSSHNDVKLLIFLLKRSVAGQSDLNKLILDTLGESFKNDKGSMLDSAEVLNAAKLPLFEQVERYIQILNLTSKQDSVCYIQAFQDLVFDFTQKKSSDINEFLQWWNLEGAKKSVQAGAMSDAVQVMTIHKAKGLDFPVTLVPLSEPKNIPDTKWLRNEMRGLSTDVPLLPIALSKELEGTVYENDYKEEQLYRKIDNLNVIYVALTRPRNALYLYSTPVGNSHELYNWVTKTLESFDELEMQIDEDDTTITYAYGELMEKSSDKELKPKTSNITQVEGAYPSVNKKAKFRLQTETSLQHRGNVLHGILQFVKTAADKEKAMKRAERMGLISPDSEIDGVNELEYYSSKLDEIFDNSYTKSWFDGTYPKVWNERTIISESLYRPDRIMEKDGELLVVDYKFGEQNNKYYAQIRNYVKLLKQMNKWSNVRGCLYYHETKSLQWV